MADPKKGMASLIVASAKPSEAPMEESMEADPKQAAAEELMDAMKSGDPAAVVEAFSALQELCQYSGPESEME